MKKIIMIKKKDGGDWRRKVVIKNKNIEKEE